MKSLQNSTMQRLQRNKKTQAYKQMLDQQIRLKRQMQKESDRKFFLKRNSTEPSYNMYQNNGYQIHDTIEKQSSTFLPIISSKTPKHQQKLLNIKKPKPLTYNSHNFQSSQDETQQYLKDCQQIIQNLRMLTQKNVNNSKKHQRSLSTNFKKQRLTNIQTQYFAKQFSSPYQYDRHRRHEPQILRISLPQERSNSLQYNSKSATKSNKNSKQPILYDEDKTQRPKNRYQKPGQHSQSQPCNQFEDDFDNKKNEDLVGPKSKRTKTIDYQNDSKVSSGRRSDNHSGLSSKNLGNSNINKNRLFSDENAKSGRYRTQQIVSSPLKNSNIKQQNQEQNFSGGKYVNQSQQDLNNSRILEKNTTVLKHLMKARQRGTLLFKKIKQFKQQRQTLKKQYLRKQTEEELKN